MRRHGRISGIVPAIDGRAARAASVATES